MRKTIEKWYKKLNFPQKYDEEFYEILSSEELDENASPENYDIYNPNGRKNLLMYLYFLENLHNQYEKKGIPEEVFSETVRDLVRWTITWSDLKGKLWLEELTWLRWHFSMKLFRIGRLQYLMTPSDEDIPIYGVKKGDNVLDLHIPPDGAFGKEECIKSLKMANEFFKKYFPEFQYKCFTCFSWLLDDTLAKYVSPSSNILAFGRMFDIIKREERFSVIPYVFGWKTTKDDIENLVPKNAFAARIKEAIIGGEQFYRVMGARSKEV